MDKLATPLLHDIDEASNSFQAQAPLLETEYSLLGRILYRSKNQHRSAKFFHAFRCAVREAKRCFESVADLNDRLAEYRREFRSATTEEVAQVFEPKVMVPTITVSEELDTRIKHVLNSLEKVIARNIEFLR